MSTYVLDCTVTAKSMFWFLKTELLIITHDSLKSQCQVKLRAILTLPHFQLELKQKYSAGAKSNFFKLYSSGLKEVYKLGAIQKVCHRPRGGGSQAK